MNCSKCGTPLNEGAAFCPNCGEKVAAPTPNPTPAPTSVDAAASAQTAGTAPTPEANPIPTVNPDPTATAPAPQKKQLLIAGGAILVALVIVIVLISCIFGGTSAKGAIKNYYNAVENANASKIIKCVPKDILKAMMDEEDMSKKEVKEAVQDYIDDMYDDHEFDYIKVTFKDKEKLDKDDIDDDLDFESMFDDDNDFKKIKKAVKYDVKIKVSTDDGDNVDTTTEEHYVYKYGNSWYIADAVSFVALAIYSY